MDGQHTCSTYVLSHTMGLQAVADAEGASQPAKRMRQPQPLVPIRQELIQEETHAHLSTYGYEPELYGVRPCSSSTVDYVLQPWYQQLLKVGEIQVLGLLM